MDILFGGRGRLTAFCVGAPQKWFADIRHRFWSWSTKIPYFRRFFASGVPGGWTYFSERPAPQTTFFFVGGLSGKAKLDFPTKGDFEPTKKPKKIFAPAAQLKNNFFFICGAQNRLLRVQNSCRGPVGETPFPRQPDKKKTLSPKRAVVLLLVNDPQNSYNVGPDTL